MSWGCKSCGCINWSSRSACRACEVAAWPSLGQSGSAHHKKKKGPAASSAGPAGAPQNKVDQTVVKTAVRVVATSATAVVTASAAGGTVTDHVDLTVHSAPKGMTASSVAALKAELAGLEAALASLVGSNGSASASVAAQVQASVDALRVQIRDKRPPGERLEGLRGAIQRGEQRLLTAKQELAVAVAKMEAEQALREVSAASGMELVIIRPPLVYGPGVKANFAALVRLVRRGWPLPLGAIHNQRSLVSLDNLVDLIMTCLRHPRAAGEAFLVSDGQDLSTTELVRGLGKALGRVPVLVPVPAMLLRGLAAATGRSEVVQRLCGNLQVDVTRARQLLGWSPPVPVAEGLRRAVGGAGRP